MKLFSAYATLLTILSSANQGLADSHQGRDEGDDLDLERPKGSLSNLKMRAKPAAVLKEYPAPADLEARRRLSSKDRAFRVEDVTTPNVVTALEGHGTKGHHQRTEGMSDAWVVVELLREFIEQGQYLAEIQQSFIDMGYTEAEMRGILLAEEDALTAYIELMDGLAQLEVIESIPEASGHDDTETDAFGNEVQGPAAHITSGGTRKLQHSGKKVVHSSTKQVHTASSGTKAIRYHNDKEEVTRGRAEKPRTTNHEAFRGNAKEHNVRARNSPQARSASCSVSSPEWLGDGYCDYGEYNTAACGFDGGDCCEVTCQNGDQYTCGQNGYDCQCSVSSMDWLGDGYCDYGDYNTAGCGFDGGDCCATSCTNGAEYSCGENDYDCQDPSESCTPTTYAAAGIGGGIGPGFKIRNDTPWPVEISLWQTGPLYWELVQPGQWFHRSVGAVWFTVKAEIRMDGQPKIDVWDAVWPVAVIVASIILAVLTLGSSAAISVGTGGAAVASSTTAAIASTLVGLGVKASTALFISTTITGVGTAAGVAAVAKPALVAGGTIIAREIIASEGMEGISSNMIAVSSAGVYAGYEWPFREETQQIVVEGGLKMAPALVEDECQTLVYTDGLTNLRFRCIAGDCYV